MNKNNAHLKLEDFPHLVKLKEETKQIAFGTKEYWQKRCEYLEKSLDPTYSDFERSNCRSFYLILCKK